MRGKAGMRMTRRSDTLPLQEIDLIYIGGNFSTEHHDDDGQPHRGFACCNGDHEQRRHLPCHRLQVMREGHQVDICGIQHDLDGHENNNEVPPNEHTQDARHKQNGTEGDIGGEGNHGFSVSVFDSQGCIGFGNRSRRGFGQDNGPDNSPKQKDADNFKQQ